MSKFKNLLAEDRKMTKAWEKNFIYQKPKSERDYLAVVEDRRTYLYKEGKTYMKRKANRRHTNV